MRIRKSDGEQRPHVQPSPIRLSILPTKKLVTRETSEYAFHEETPVSEAQEQHEGSPNKRMKIAMPETYVRMASATRRRRTSRKLHSGVTTLIESPTPPCPITQARQLSLGAGLLDRMKNGGSSKEWVGKQRPDVRPSPIGLATESRDYSSHEETSVFEAREQHEGTSPKNLRRKKIDLQETSVRNARTHSLKVKRYVYNRLDNRFVSSSCGEGTHSHPLPAAAHAIWMDSATSVSLEPHQQHTTPDWYNFHLLADMATKVSEAESGKLPMETPQVSLELGHTLQETKPQLYEGELAMETHQSASKEETAMSKAAEQPQDVNKTMDSTTPATPEPQISFETWLREPDSQSSGEEWAMENYESPSKQKSAMSETGEQPQDANKILESFSPNVTVCNLSLLPRTDDSTVEKCPDREALLNPPVTRSDYEFPGTVDLTLHRNPGGGHVQVGGANSGDGMFSVASQSAELQMYASEPMVEATEYPCSAVQRPPPAVISPTRSPICLPNPLQVQQDLRRGAPQHPPLLRTAYEAIRNQPLPAVAPFPSTVTQVGHMQVYAAKSAHGMFYFVPQSAGVQMYAGEPVLEATQYPCSVAERPPNALVSPARCFIDLSNPLEIQQAVADILTSDDFVDKLGAVFTSSMVPLLQGPMSGSPANPVEDGLNESSVITEGSTANASKK